MWTPDQPYVPILKPWALTSSCLFCYNFRYYLHFFGFAHLASRAILKSGTDVKSKSYVQSGSSTAILANHVSLCALGHGHKTGLNFFPVRETCNAIAYKDILYKHAL